MGDAANPRPTGALVNVSLRHPSFYRGWPKLRRRSDGTWSYEGPLPSNCTCSRKTSHGSTATATCSTPLESPALSCWAELLLARGTESGLRGLPSGWGSASQVDSQQASQHSDGEGSDDTWVPEEDIESEVQDLAGGPRDGHLCRELGIRTDSETNSYKQASGGRGSFCFAVSSLVCSGPRTYCSEGGGNGWMMGVGWMCPGIGSHRARRQVPLLRLRRPPPAPRHIVRGHHFERASAKRPGHARWAALVALLKAYSGRAPLRASLG